MAFYKLIYNIFSYPFGWLINLLYNLNGKNYLVAVIALAVIVKLVLLPSSISQQKNQVKSKRMQARVNRIREKYKDDQQKMNEEVQAFYKKEGYGSMSMGCGTLLIQFPIIMGLYGAIYYPLTYILRVNGKFGKGTVDALTAAVTKLVGSGSSGSAGRIMEIQVLSSIDKLKANCDAINPDLYAYIKDFAVHFRAGGFNFGDIPKAIYHDTPIILIIPIAAFLASLATSIYSLIRSKKRGDMNNASSMASMGCMMLFMPFMSLWLAWQFPVGIGIYWAVNSLLGFVQMFILDILYKPDDVIAKVMVEETNIRREKEVNSKNKAAGISE